MLLNSYSKARCCNSLGCCCLLNISVLAAKLSMGKMKSFNKSSVSIYERISQLSATKTGAHANVAANFSVSAGSFTSANGGFSFNSNELIAFSKPSTGNRTVMEPKTCRVHLRLS